jgi:hypothetical protein
VLIGSCTINIGAQGKIVANPSLSTMSSKQAGGSMATASVTASSLLCALGDCFYVSAPAPVGFTSSPNGANAGTVFTTGLRVGPGPEGSGNTPVRVANGTHNLQVHLTATKSAGLFPAGNYQSQVTVRCE